MPNSLRVIQNTSCFAEHSKRNLSCLKSSCRLHDENMQLNCTNIHIIEYKRETDGISQKDLEIPFNHIGEIFGKTSMTIYKRIRDVIPKAIKKNQKRLLGQYKNEMDEITDPTLDLRNPNVY